MIYFAFDFAPFRVKRIIKELPRKVHALTEQKEDQDEEEKSLVNMEKKIRSVARAYKAR